MKRLLLILLLFPALAVGQDTLRVDSVSLEGTISSDSYSGLLIGDGLLQQFYDTTLIDSVVLRDSTVYDTLWTHSLLSVASDALWDVSWQHKRPVGDSTYTLTVNARSLADSLKIGYFIGDSTIVKTYFPDGRLQDSITSSFQGLLRLHLRAFKAGKIYTYTESIDTELINNLN